MPLKPILTREFTLPDPKFIIKAKVLRFLNMYAQYPKQRTRLSIGRYKGRTLVEKLLSPMSLCKNFHFFRSNKCKFNPSKLPVPHHKLNAPSTDVPTIIIIGAMYFDIGIKLCAVGIK
jgi:hypothetical protein